MLIRRDRRLLVVAALPASMLIVLGAQQMYFARFVLPTVPALVVIGAAALESLMQVRALIALAAAFVVAAPTVVDAVRFDVLLTREDTRAQARTWLDQNLPGGTVVAVDAPPLGPTLASSIQQASLASDGALFDVSLADYRARGVEYAIASSFVSEARPKDPARDARRLAFYTQLDAEAQVIARFRPYPGSRAPGFEYDQIYAPWTALDELERPGPAITVYRLTTAGPQSPP
jgi:hypothetical protein